jgi:hypothetical protein
MGTSLPTVFANSSTKFGINLDPDTILALFSSKNVSCKTENALISFSGLQLSSDTRNTRRSFILSSSDNKAGAVTPSLSTIESNPVFATRSVATMNGILYDDSDAKANRATESTESTAATIPSTVLEFSKIAVLYIFEQTRSFDFAANTKQIIFSYLVHYYNSAIHPSVQVLGGYDLDLENKTITLPNGTMIGGKFESGLHTRA